MINYKTQHAAKLALATSALALGTSSAFAVDFDGYFRAGPGATKKDAARACYDLGISAGHYRLGNECDFYGEFGLTQVGTVNDVTYKARLMLNQYSNGTDTGKSNTNFHQMYLEGKGFDISPETNFWVGKRFYGRTDVHIVDTFFVRMDGVGAGADNISLGSAKLGVAYFSSDTGVGLGDSGNRLSTNPGNRVNVDLTEIPVNPGGKFRVTGTFTKGRFENATNGRGTNGVGVSLQHQQQFEGMGGLKNTAWFQYAQGSAGLDGNFGTITAPSDVKKWRLVESFTWQAGRFGGQAIALYGVHDKDTVNLVDRYKEMSIGGRASYAVTNNFKLVAEVGHMEKRPDSTPTQKLTKFTFAPTLSAGPGFFNRPELRLYVTHARWNDAANAGTGLGGLTGLGDGKTRGTSFGAQVEMWF
jgi:maltoporin